MSIGQEDFPARPLHVNRNGHCLSISPEDEHHLGGRLCVPVRRPTSDSDHGYDVLERLEPLVSGVRIANSGMLKLLWLLLRSRGYAVDKDFLPTIPVAPEHRCFGTDFPEALRFMFNNVGGILRVGKDVDLAALVVAIIWQFITDRIVIIGRGKLLRSVYCGVRDLFPNRFWFEQNAVFVDDKHPYVEENEYPQVAFSTPYAAADIGAEHCKYAILVDAFDSLHSQVNDFLTQVDARFRLFGIQQVRRRPTRYEQAILYRVFGFEQIELESHNRVRRDVRHDFVPIQGDCPQGAVVPRTQRTTGRKADLIVPRRAYVYHKRRNQKICRIARDLFDQDVPVVILVEQLDHAIQLATRLPDWPIYARPESDLSGIRCEMRACINPPVPTRRYGLKAIVVADAARQFPGYYAKGIIWAGGGYSVRVPRPWLFEFRDHQYPARIIDFLDRFSPEVFAASEHRRAMLNRMGIFDLNAEASLERVKRFARELRLSPSTQEGVK